MRWYFTLMVAWVASAALAGPIAAVRAAPVDLDDDVFRDNHLGIRFATPAGWVLTRQTGYLELVAIVTSRGDPVAQINVTVTRLAAGQTVRELVRENNVALNAVGLTVRSVRQVQHLGRTLWRTTIRPRVSANPSIELRQLYIADAQRIFVFTLTTATKNARQNLMALDELLQSLRLSRQAPK